MKKIYTLLVVMLMLVAVPMTASCFSYTGEQMVVSNDNASAPVVSYNPATGLEKAIKGLRKEMKNLKGDNKSSQKEFSRSIDKNTAATTQVVESQRDVSSAVNGLTKKADTASNKLDDIKELLAKIAAWIFVVFIIGILVIIAIFLSNRNVVKKIEMVPAETHELVAMENQIEVINVDGIDWLYSAPLICGKRRSLKVPTSVTGKFTSPDLIPRAPETTIQGMKASVAKTLTQDAAGKFDGDHQHSINQKAVIALAKKSGQLIERV